MGLFSKFRFFVSNSILNPSIWIYWLLVYLVFSSYQFYFIVFILLFGALFNFLPFYLIRKLELSFSPMDSKAMKSYFHILVLGGGHHPEKSTLWEHQLNNSSIRRVLEGVRLFKMNQNSILVMSGNSLRLGHPSQAEIQAHVAETMGINSSDIVSISEPTNTEQEASCYKSRINNGNIPIVIVTKALHLRRAAFIFSSHGFRTYCAPAFYAHREFQPSLLWFLFPNFRLISLYGEYLKEVVGYYLLFSLIWIGFKNFHLKGLVKDDSIVTKKFA